MHTEDVSLPSGKSLKITLSPFAVSRALYQAVLDELKGLKVDGNAEIDVNLMKDLFCAGFSSKKIEGRLDECFKKVLYDGKRITADTFEDIEAREDYLLVCWEVAHANIRPFVKYLWQKYSGILGSLQKPPEPKSPTTTS